MAYTKYHADWQDYPSTATPITAAALEQIEQGIVDAAADADQALADIAAFTAPAFIMAGTVPGDLDVGELVEGGVAVPIATTLNKVLITVDREPRGANLVISVIKRERTTGTESTIGTATITSNTGKRATITGLSTALAVDDRIMLRCTQVGSEQPGSGLEWAMLDSDAPAFPTALSAPAAPTGGSATVTSGTNVTVSWTAPASGVYHSVEVFKDGAWVARVLKGTTSYVDLAAFDDSHTYTLYATNNDAVSSALTVNYTPGASSIGTPVDLGVAVYGGASTSNSLDITVGTACSAGDLVVVVVGGSVPGNAGVTVSAADDRSNSYTTHIHNYDETHSQQSAIISSKITTGLQVGDTITVTWSVATSRLMGRAYKVTGIAASNHFDKSASRNVFTPNATVNLSTNATATLSQAKEIAFAIHSVQWPAGQGATTSWNLGTLTDAGASTNNKGLVPTWRIVDSTAALTGTGTLNSAAAQSSCIATFKGA